MRSLRMLLIATMTTALSGCVCIDPNLDIEVSHRANPWTHLDLYNEWGNFQFAIVPDRTGGHRPGVFGDAMEKLNLLKPEFVMSVGDMIEGKTEDSTLLDSQRKELDSLVGRLDMPFFYVPGNHDISNELMARRWRRQFGRSYYHFIYRKVLFLCLSTEDPPKRNISANQADYFRKVLKANQDVRWTLVFMHQPVWKDPASENWLKLESLLADRPHTVFAGHLHRYSKSTRHGSHYYLLATAGGHGAGENGSPAGLSQCQFDHVVWVTMSDEGPVVANLLLDGILDDDPCSNNAGQ
jgi:hypothetical protein